MCRRAPELDEDLAGMDAAVLQVRREARGAIAVGPIAVIVVAVDPVDQECREASEATGLSWHREGRVESRLRRERIGGDAAHHVERRGCG